MKIVLTGANGQVGLAFQALAKTDAFPIGWTLLPLDRNHLDLADPDTLWSHLDLYKPDLIINAAAYTQVDKAETEIEVCDAINSDSPWALAQFCLRNKIPLVHFSTDYVYSGKGENTRVESESVSPTNHYGQSKARGDLAILQSGCDHLIFRTSWVYSFEGKNFVKTMLRIGAEKPDLTVVSDQIGSPTYAPDLAMYALDATMQAMEAKAGRAAFPSGVYHLTNSGFTSWCEFAQAILPGKKITGILTSDYPTPAKRPLNSRLSLEKFKNTFKIEPRPWQEALQDCLAHLKG